MLDGFLFRPYAFALPVSFPDPAAPLVLHAPNIASLTSCTPSLFRTAVNSVGPRSRIFAASLRITSNDAPT